MMNLGDGNVISRVGGSNITTKDKAAGDISFYKPVTSQQRNRGENNFNSIQINLNRAKQVNNDLGLCNHRMNIPIIIAQDTNISKKSNLNFPSRDLSTYSMAVNSERPRAFIFTKENAYQILVAQ